MDTASLSLRRFRRDCLLGALSALLMLAGDLCLSVIPASAGDSGLFSRQAYLSGAYETWRLPLLLLTGLPGMALAFFTVRASYTAPIPQNADGRADRRRDLCLHRRGAALFHRQSGRLGQPSGAPSGPGRNAGADTGPV